MQLLPFILVVPPGSERVQDQQTDWVLLLVDGFEFVMELFLMLLQLMAGF